MKSSSAVTLSFLAAASAQGTQSYSQNAATGPAFLNSGYDVKPGQDFVVQLQGCSDGCVINVKEGDSNNLQNPEKPVSFNVKGDQATINIPAGSSSDKLALQVTDSKGNINYSPQFPVGGNGASGANPPAKPNNPNPNEKPTQAPADTEPAASQTDRQLPTNASPPARESKDASAAPEVTITSSPSTATQSSDSDDDATTTVAAAPSASDSSSSTDSSSTSTTPGSRNASRTSSSSTSTRTATSTRVAGESGVGHNAVPWLLSGVMALVAYLN